MEIRYQSGEGIPMQQPPPQSVYVHYGQQQPQQIPPQGFVQYPPQQQQQQQGPPPQSVYIQYEQQQTPPQGFVQYPPPQQQYPQYGQQQLQQQSYYQRPPSGIHVRTATRFQKIWDDTNIGTPSPSASFFEPTGFDGFYPVGHVAERGRNGDVTYTRGILLKEERFTDEGPQLLAPPTSFEEMWNDNKTKAKYGDCSIWKPVPPKGYVALGCVVVRGYKAPSTDSIRCVHSSAVAPGVFAFEDDDYSLWNDRDTGAPFADVSIWRIAPKRPGGLLSQSLSLEDEDCEAGLDCGTFGASKNYLKPEADAFVPYCLAERVVLSHDFSYQQYGQQQQQQQTPSVQPQQQQQQQQGSYPQGYQMSQEEINFNQQPMYPSAPIQIGPAVNIIPFKLQPEDARAAFTKWKESLWFAPSTLKNASESDIKMKAIFLPFYIFDTCVTSSYHGDVGRIIRHTHTPTMGVTIHLGNSGHGNHHHHHHHHNVPQDYTETKWEHGCGTNHKDYDHEVVCATTKDENRKAIAKINDWNLSAAQIGSTDVSALETPLNWKTAWDKYVEKKVVIAERYCCERKLKSDYHADCVRSVVTKTKFDSIKFKSVYVPMYEMSYNHDGHYYKVLINGQTGKVDGERPIGLGMVGELFSSIGSFFQGEQESSYWTDGKTLNQLEAKTGWLSSKVEWYYYIEKCHYLVLPSSRSGWVELENLSDRDLEIGSQKRKEGRVLTVSRIRPGSSVIFNFSGWWLIRILSEQTPDDVKIVGFASNQFSSKVSREEANKLKMV